GARGRCGQQQSNEEGANEDALRHGSVGPPVPYSRQQATKCTDGRREEQQGVRRMEIAHVGAPARVPDPVCCVGGGASSPTTFRMHRPAPAAIGLRPSLPPCSVTTLAACRRPSHSAGPSLATTDGKPARSMFIWLKEAPARRIIFPTKM